MEEASFPEIEEQSLALTQDHVLATGGECNPSGAHVKHGSYSCQTCHMCGGVLQFDPAGPAVAAGRPAPAFDATTKTCTNVACHGMYSGTFDFWFQEEFFSWSYAGNGGTTPSWYTTGNTCGACHNNPPAPYEWHGGHAPSMAGGNDCQTCHADAIGVNGVGVSFSTATNCGPARNQPCRLLHANGVVDVTARFTSRCAGCH